MNFLRGYILCVMLILHRSSRMVRRSARLMATSKADEPEKLPANKKPRKETVVKTKKNTEKVKEESVPCLPRTREKTLLKDFKYIIGVDEAGRGPLAGPVVAAAAWIPENIEGITDSKKLNDESLRDELYDKIINSKNAHWAVAIVDSKRIDEINILQATLEGMRLAATALTEPPEQVIDEASADIEGCYVVRRCATDFDPKESYALVDGNRLPKDMPMQTETIVKGDSKEYCIAAASILAKVTRDRIMNAYHEMYPDFNFIQHKGYPTKAHMQVIHKIGATPIHRYTFAPLKHMEFDSNGKVIGKAKD